MNTTTKTNPYPIKTKFPHKDKREDAPNEFILEMINEHKKNGFASFILEFSCGSFGTYIIHEKCTIGIEFLKK